MQAYAVYRIGDGDTVGVGNQGNRSTQQQYGVGALFGSAWSARGHWENKNSNRHRGVELIQSGVLYSDTVGEIQRYC